MKEETRVPGTLPVEIGEWTGKAQGILVIAPWYILI